MKTIFCAIHSGVFQQTVTSLLATTRHCFEMLENGKDVCAIVTSIVHWVAD